RAVADVPRPRSGEGPRADAGSERSGARPDLGGSGGPRHRGRLARVRVGPDRLGRPPRPALEPASVPRPGVVRRRRLRGRARQPGEGRLRVPRVRGRRAAGGRPRERQRPTRAGARLRWAAGAGRARSPRLRGVADLMGWLTLTTFLPLTGVAVLLAWRRAPHGVARAVALVASIATFIVSLRVLGRFDGSVAGFQMVERAIWVRSPRIEYLLGIDGVSLFLVLLTTFLMPIAILASWTVEHRVRLYMAAMLVLETGMLGTFLALDLVLFFLFFEAILFPMYLIIGGWGGERRIYAAVKFFLYTMFGSAFLLVAILVLYAKSGVLPGGPTFDVRQLVHLSL